MSLTYPCVLTSAKARISAWGKAPVALVSKDQLFAVTGNQYKSEEVKPVITLQSHWRETRMSFHGLWQWCKQDGLIEK